MRYANGRPVMVLKGVSVWGVPLPNAWLGNLKNIDLTLPRNRLIVITGVSGSGKTSLVFDVIADSYLAGRPVQCGTETPRLFSTCRLRR